MAKRFKMAKLNDGPCSCEHDEYSDPLEIAASAGARLSTGNQAHNCKMVYCSCPMGEPKKS